MEEAPSLGWCLNRRREEPYGQSTNIGVEHTLDHLSSNSGAGTRPPSGRAVWDETYSGTHKD